MFLFFHGYIDPDGSQELHLYCMGRKGEKKSIVAFCLGILRHTSRVFFEYQYVYVSCTAVLLQHENSKNKCQSIEQQGKKVEQKLICHYKKETTKNKKTGAIYPQEKNPLFVSFV